MRWGGSARRARRGCGTMLAVRATRRALIRGAAALPLLSAATRAQGFPSQPVRIIVPFPPGAADFLPRLIEPRLREVLGQPVVIENRDGASGMIGAAYVARAQPDGHTLLMTTPSSQITPLYLSRNMPYDPVRDFTPITAAAEAVTCLVVSVETSVRDAAGLVELARRSPGKLSYGSSGTGSVFHMTGEVLNEVAGLEMMHVPFRGTGPAMVALLGRQIDALFCALVDARAHAEAGRVRILAVLEGERFAARPEIPTLAETVPGFRKPASWFGLFGPARLPEGVPARMHEAVVKVLAMPDMAARLSGNGIRVVGSPPGVFAAQLREGIAQYGEIIRAAGLRPE
ncbi:Bug family tripartite tricarboxylate transporter substrate binding protein [Muricoccus aerilatus]|uniref:Bug family tripartite tricarboxylate transporter substrate binding protein n=1 Tax=Muricoccus aerilatus TaxID=452982 RepID=UPI0009FF8D8E|nr:tripartite tricarboxylate transporter substrate binding protein [Roseomonas aerilata]